MSGVFLCWLWLNKCNTKSRLLKGLNRLLFSIHTVYELIPFCLYTGIHPREEIVVKPSLLRTAALFPQHLTHKQMKESFWKPPTKPSLPDDNDGSRENITPSPPSKKLKHHNDHPYSSSIKSLYSREKKLYISQDRLAYTRTKLKTSRKRLYRCEKKISKSSSVV